MSETGELKEDSASSLGQSVHLSGAGSSGLLQNTPSSTVGQDEKVEEREDILEETLDESEIGEDFVEYETTDFINRPIYSKNSTFKRDPLELEYSYGYDCKRPNLCVVDPDTLLWYTGNIIHIFDAKQKHLSFRRSALGQGISCIAKSKATDEFAVAENGGKRVSPMIIIYKWPNFKVCSVLRGGATISYMSIDFSCDGAKLVSQAGLHSGATLTIWNIRQKTAITSFPNPDKAVRKAVFSSFDPNVFVTFGIGHIKFWRLTDTFTGLNVDSLPGRFDEVENNISVICFLPGGRVASNFRGGNLAIWKPDGTLELTFSMKNDEPCHSDLITFIQFYSQDNLLYTSSLDGNIRVWNYSYITKFYGGNQHECKHVDIAPLYIRRITTKGENINFAKPVQLLPKDERSFPYHFYVQDINGGIWLLDLELKKTPDPWTKLYCCHPGPLYDMSPSPGDYYLAALGPPNKVHVYCHNKKSVVVTKQFKDEGICLLWLPLQMNPTGNTIAIGFRSGILRVIVVRLRKGNREIPMSDLVGVTQIIKPHSSAITVLSTDKGGNLLISGSEDKSIFLFGFRKESLEFVPLGMIQMPGAVTDIAWDPVKPWNRFLVSCDNGQVAQIILNDKNEQIIRKSFIKNETYLLNIPLTITQADMQGKAKKSSQYFSRYMGKDLIWIEDRSSHLSRYNRNYLYKIGGSLIAKVSISDGQTVQYVIELLGGRYMALALNNGVIKLIKRGKRKGDLSDSWRIIMHASRNCNITKLCLSYDHKILYSCGTDSGIFAYKVNLYDIVIKSRHLTVLTALPKCILSPPRRPVIFLSLEEERIQQKKEIKEEKHRMLVKKFKVKLIMFMTSYFKLVEMNKSLPKCLQIPKAFFRLQTREDRVLEKQKSLAKERSILDPLKARKKRLFERVHSIKKYFIDPIKTQKFYLFAIRTPNYLKSFPERRLFSKDPLEEDVDPAVKETEERWKELFSELETKRPNEPTDFEMMIKKVVRKLAKEREMEIYYDHSVDAKNEGNEQDSQKKEMPDLITTAGAFMNEHGKFTQVEKTVFNRLNANRLKRLKCAKELGRVDNLKNGFHNFYEKVDSSFKNLIKTDTKDKEKVPSVTERLHLLLNIRQLIYLHKENFNKALRALRKKKNAIISYCFWAQVEYKYMIKDLKQHDLDLNGIKLPRPIQVVWDLEYPDHLNFKPGPMPEDIKSRMDRYKKDLKQVRVRIAPQDDHKKQVTKQSVHDRKLLKLMKKRKERFRHSMITIRETLDKMVTEFDSEFMPLILQRSKASLEINYLKAEYSSTLQEVDILYRYEILQTSVSCYKYETLKTKHVFILRENIRKKKIGRFNEQMKGCHGAIDELNSKFTELVKDDKWGKHLTRTYKRKYKPPRKDGSTESALSSDSSSDDDDDDYDDEGTDDDLDDDEGTGVAYIYDETIIPPGCDEEKFRHTFKLRLQRHAEENRIAEIKRDKEVIMGEVESIKKVIKVCDGLLALFYSGTFRFQEMMKDEMSDIDYLISLHPSQIQIFDKKKPLKNVPHMEECKLIEQKEYKIRTKAVRHLKHMIYDVSGVVANTKRSSKMQLKDLHRLADKNSKRYQEIEAILASTFGRHMEVDVGQTYILMSMMKRTIRRTAQELMSKENYQKKKDEKMEHLRNKGEMIRMKRKKKRTLHKLYTIEAENNRVMADKLKRATKLQKNDGFGNGDELSDEKTGLSRR